MAKKQEHVECSFCGKSKEQTTLMIGGMGIFICDECAERAHQMVLEEKKIHQKPNTGTNDLKKFKDYSSFGIANENDEMFNLSSAIFYTAKDRIYQEENANKELSTISTRMDFLRAFVFLLEFFPLHHYYRR